MIEVLFGESEAGSMKAAKCQAADRIGGHSDGPTSYIGYPPAGVKPPAQWIPGSSSEVICLGFMLDVGDIREDVDSDYRKNLIFSLYARDQWGEDEELLGEMRKLGDSYVQEWTRLRKFLEAGEPIRVWYSESPYSLCGFTWLCHKLRAHEGKVYAVKLPEYRELEGNVIQCCRNWGEVSAEEFAGFLPYERRLSKTELHLFADQWTELVRDNSPLRASLNGVLVGVPEDFYDFLIRKCITEKPVKEARLIGNILGTYPVSTGDWWYASRIDDMIEAGEIRVVEDSRRKYARLICRARK